MMIFMSATFVCRAAAIQCVRISVPLGKCPHMISEAYRSGRY